MAISSSGRFGGRLDSFQVPAVALDRDLIRTHHIDFSYLVGRFMVEHLARVHRAFDGDLLAALVLGTIGQHNMRLFYDEVVAKSTESIEELVARGAHVTYLRPCNAMSVSASTGIPRETVRRKIRLLAERGWVEQVGRDKLYITRAVARHFMDFDIETVERFCATADRIVLTAERRAAGAATVEPVGTDVRPAAAPPATHRVQVVGPELPRPRVAAGIARRR
jgi:hypothetical protein